MAAAGSIQVSVPEVSERSWTTLDELREAFSDQEIVTMVHRYCDAEQYRREYRKRRDAKMRAYVKAAKEAGLTIDGDGEGTRVELS